MKLSEIKALEQKAADAYAAYTAVGFRQTQESCDLHNAWVVDDLNAQEAKLSAWPAVVALLEEARAIIEGYSTVDVQTGYRMDALLARIDGDLSK